MKLKCHLRQIPYKISASYDLLFSIPKPINNQVVLKLKFKPSHSVIRVLSEGIAKSPL